LVSGFAESPGYSIALEKLLFRPAERRFFDGKTISNSFAPNRFAFGRLVVALPRYEDNMKLFLFVLAILFAAGCEKISEQSSPDAAYSDPQALQIADEVMVALGGRKNYEAVKYLSFHFVVAKGDTQLSDWRHDWDRRNNNYRLESAMRDGNHFLAMFNLDTKKGAVFKNGQALEDEDKIQWLSRAYARYINDTYWLLMPYKLKDPGVTLNYDGKQEVNGFQYDVVSLSFADSVGLTPWNMYRVFVDEATRLVHRWEYFERTGAAPEPAWWENWRVYEGIKLAEERVLDNSGRKILFTNIIASREVDEKIFEISTPSLAMRP
jgi:hypothetical protein